MEQVDGEAAAKSGSNLINDFSLGRCKLLGHKPIASVFDPCRFDCCLLRLLYKTALKKLSNRPGSFQFRQFRQAAHLDRTLGWIERGKRLKDSLLAWRNPFIKRQRVTEIDHHSSDRTDVLLHSRGQHVGNRHSDWSAV